jgi:tetratricopeptide (TPR) repeat protein
MTCDDIEDRALAVEYLLGRLGEKERDAYELHYFECARCYAALQALRSVRLAAGESRPSAALRAARPAWRREWLAAAAALAVIGGGGALLWQVVDRSPRDAAPPPAASATSPGPSSVTPSTPPAMQLAEMAVVIPPPYAPARLRAAGDEAFDTGMKRYQSGDYPDAIPALERATRGGQTSEVARFYLGISYLLADRPADAVNALEPLAAGADSPYAEPARFFTAKAWLRAGDVQRAAEALDRTIELHGDREREAAEIRRKLAGLPRP